MAKQICPVFIPSIALDKNTAVPMHRQLYLGVRSAILTGQLRAAIKLPSTREWARHFEVSRNTVLTAFEQLLADGFLEGKVGSGTFVAARTGFERYAGPARTGQDNPLGRPPLSATAELLAIASRSGRSEDWGRFAQACLPSICSPGPPGLPWFRSRREG
jgi:DNA-binding GntR family transcriptional regulator